MQKILIELPWPASQLWSNARVHWAKKARSTKLARELAAFTAISNNLSKLPVDAKVTLSFTYHPTPASRQDVHNVPYALKSYIDGIQDATGINDKHFTIHFPTSFAEFRKKSVILLEVLIED